ncbi:MAG: hypothetical protein COA88_09145 [Kordia sp.]|nr:MAG: hypothetical protein COA88_09145 [Kordia sp.]
MLLLYYLIQNNCKPELVFLLGSLDIILHSYIGSYYIGFESNYIYFMLSLPLVLYFDQNWSSSQKKSYVLGIGILLVSGIFFFKSHTPINNLNVELINNIAILNTLIIATGVFFIVYHFNKIVKENDLALLNTNRLLMEQNLESDKQLKRQDILLREIHHRMKNNLQVVTSLLRLQLKDIDDQKAIDILKETQNRVLSLARLHEKMYRSDDLEHINVKQHLTVLTEDLIKNYSVNQNIKTNIQVDDVKLGVKTLVPLGLIINEIITNSLKYAFTNINNGEITVHLKQDTPTHFELIIGDNGSGMKGIIENNGLGSKLIKIFTQQLNGTISKQQKPGTMYNIQFEKIDG